uniref:Secreted protein n=1 Tax=Achlya hypogyna TaxID=1202772 RepID=A0A0A7CP20_ACHHY|nr:secreted protein [Achlya hypogyna]
MRATLIASLAAAAVAQPCPNNLATCYNSIGAPWGCYNPAHEGCCAGQVYLLFAANPNGGASIPQQCCKGPVGANGRNTFSVVQGDCPATTAAPVAKPVAAWGKCGGQNYSGPTKCADGNYCKELNPYYSQCTPGGPNEVGVWGQCGGTGYSGATAYCKSWNTQYSQCIPNGTN